MIRDGEKTVIALNVSVQGISYRDLWDHWDAIGDPVLTRHTQLLRDRYDVAIS